MQFFGLSCTTQIRLSQRFWLAPKPWKLLTFSNSLVFGCKPFCLCIIPQKKAFVGHERVFVSIPCLSRVVFPSAGQQRDPTNAHLRTHAGGENKRKRLYKWPHSKKNVSQSSQAFQALKANNQEPQLSRKLGFIISGVCRTPGVSKSLRCTFYTANRFSPGEVIITLFIFSISGAW